VLAHRFLQLAELDQLVRLRDADLVGEAPEALGV